MTQLNQQVAPSTERPNRVLWPHAFDADYAIAQCFGAGEHLQSLYAILQAVHTAERLAQEDPDRVPELLAIIHEQAAKSYRELMCAVGWVGSNPTDAAM
jgi:hypothetical protein